MMMVSITFRIINVRMIVLTIAYILCIFKLSHGKTKVSSFYHRFIRNAASASEEKNFIEAIHNASTPLYNHYYHSFTEPEGASPSCGKLCPKGIYYSSSDHLFSCSFLYIRKTGRRHLLGISLYI